VRLLPTDGLKALVARSGTHELVPVRIPLDAVREAATSPSWSRIALAGECPERRSHEQLEADQRRHRVAGQPEEEGAVAHAERDRLARLDGDAPEHLADAELRRNTAHEVVRPDRHTAGGDDDVCGERALERMCVRGFVVGYRFQRGHVGAGLPHGGREQHSVRLVDLARTKLLAGGAQLSSGREHCATRPSRAGHLRDAGCSKRAYMGRCQARARREDLLALTNVPASRPHVRAQPHLRHVDVTVVLGDVLDRDDRVRAFRHDATRRDRHRVTCTERALRGPPGGNAPGDTEGSGRVGAAYRVAVHRRARERRQVGAGVSGLGEHATERCVELNDLRIERKRLLENERNRVVERDQFVQAADTLIAVISVVVPVYDEERSVELLFDEIRAALEPLGREWETVFVDDGSADGSFAALTRLHAREPSLVRVVRLRRNFGKSAALAAGFREAQGDVVITIDADGQDDPAEIPRLLAKLEEGFDLVSGWKARRRDRWTRRLLSRVFNGVTGRISGVRLHDMNCGLKAYRAEVVRGLPLYGELHRFIPVLAHYRGFRVAELPVNHRPREHGRSRYGVERYLRGFFDLITVTFMGRYRYRPLHLFGGLGLLLGAVGFFVCLYLTILWFTGHAIGHRPLLTLGVLLVVVGIQFLSLGLIGELVTTHHEERAAERDAAERHVDEILR
jgi:glycosyltransferase involved in cell wall biosynthesis